MPLAALYRARAKGVSFFSCAVGSANFDSLMKDEPRICLRWDYPQRHADVIILQAMLMGDDRVMFELIKKSDYEEHGSLGRESGCE